jgi:hypothetical protein
MSEREGERQEATGAERTGAMKGGHDPRELAARSAEVRRANAAQQDTSDAGIVRALRKKAAKGDAAAARELREWLDRDAGEELSTWRWLELLTDEQRDAVQAIVDEVDAQRAEPA